jgi:hypothetical protein
MKAFTSLVLACALALAMLAPNAQGGGQGGGGSNDLRQLG